MRAIQTSAFAPNAGLTPNTNTKPERKSNMFKQMFSIVAVAGLVLALAPPAHAAIIDPTDPLVGSLGLLEGDTFHLVFATSQKTTATSTDIGYYNTFVNNVANDVGYTGSVVAKYDWTWKVIGSTSSIDAIANTGTTYDAQNPGNPLFRLGDYAKVVDDYANLWDGSAWPLENAINCSEKGTTGPDKVWTGTDKYGYAATTYLGAATVMRGEAQTRKTQWVSWKADDPVGSKWPNQSFYALSEAVTVTATATEVIPEPSTFLLWAFGSIGILFMRRRGLRR